VPSISTFPPKVSAAAPLLKSHLSAQLRVNSQLDSNSHARKTDMDKTRAVFT
jgi:hypothetical protein